MQRDPYNFDNNKNPLSHNLLKSYGIPELEKAEDNDLEKGGEGSKGGKVIGHTKSGKPIYEPKGNMYARKGVIGASHKNYEDYTSQDHKEVADFHREKHKENSREYLKALEKHFGKDVVDSQRNLLTSEEASKDGASRSQGGYETLTTSERNKIYNKIPENEKVRYRDGTEYNKDYQVYSYLKKHLAEADAKVQDSAWRHHGAIKDHQNAAYKKKVKLEKLIAEGKKVKIDTSELEGKLNRHIEGYDSFSKEKDW